MKLDLQSRRALIFGSSSGIGKAIASSLVAEKCVVTLASRNLENLGAAQRETGAQYFVQADTSIQGDTLRATQEAQQKMGGIDILICNTGGPQKNSFLEVSREQWLRDFESLWLSPVEAIKAVLPKMKEQGFGRIIFITSIAAKEPLPGLTTSNGLRAGLEGLCKSLANEVASFGITVNIARPGYTDTERLRELNLSSEKVQAMVPAGRLGHPSELADFVTFLASPRGAYITGQCVSIDGGAQKSF